MVRGRWTLLVAGAAILAPGEAGASGLAVEVVPREAERRVDVLVSGKPFTSYVWPTTVMKPILYPLRTASGKLLTRGYPLDPRPGERIDHPHHVGLWLNYGDVNGVDFWNNSPRSKDSARMGRIVHGKVEGTRGGPGEGELEVSAEWRLPGDRPVLAERTRFVFAADGEARLVDRVTTLTALAERVLFKDNKEGLFGIRVARALEHPATKAEILTDSAGRPTAVPVLDNAGVTGRYLSSEGKEGDAVWGTRGRWVALGGTVEGEAVTLAILDHPGNPGHPTYWHARGYGLFAANPLGQQAMSGGKEELNFALEPGASVTFRYRVLVLSAGPSPGLLEERYRAFAAEASGREAR